MSKNYIFKLISAFALLSFVSIAAGNIFLGISTLLFFIYMYKNKPVLNTEVKGYYYTIGFFVLTMLLSAFFSGDIKTGIKRWADMWIWRMMPFVIITLAIAEAKKCLNILKLSCLGISVGICCLLYQGISGDGRAAGFFGHPMTFAGYLCMYLPLFFIGFFEDVLEKKYKYFSGVMLLLGSAALIFNGTRGAWLAVAITLAIILLYYMGRNRKNLLIGLLLVCVGSGVLLNNDSFMKRVSTITNNKYQSNSERLLMWQSAWNMFKDHPVLGVGLGQYKDNYQKKYILPEAKEPKLEHAHNNFMQMLAENGAVGFIGFISMFGYIIFSNLKKFWQNRNPYALMICTMTASLLIQGLTEFNFGNSAVVKAYWLILGCLLVLAANYDENKI